MARVVMQPVVSVDGYIAYPDDTVGPLLDWYGNGDTELSARATFQTADSVEAGISLAKKLAGDGLGCVTAGDIGGQAFSAGLVDEVAMDVVPVVLGERVRFFGSHAGTVLLRESSARCRDPPSSSCCRLGRTDSAISQKSRF
jgi:dihydrofolate reductase